LFNPRTIPWLRGILRYYAQEGALIAQEFSPKMLTTG